MTFFISHVSAIVAVSSLLRLHSSRPSPLFVEFYCFHFVLRGLNAATQQHKLNPEASVISDSFLSLVFTVRGFPQSRLTLTSV